MNQLNMKDEALAVVPEKAKKVADVSWNRESKGGLLYFASFQLFIFHFSRTLMLLSLNTMARITSYFLHSRACNY